MEFTEKDILHALSHVDDPDLKKDLVTLGMIQNVRIDGNRISFILELTTPACPLKDMLKNACINAIHHFIDKDLQVEVELTSRVTSQKSNNAAVLGGIKNLIAVASGKGGVGKSTVAVNLALGLAKAGAKTGLLDADVHGPSIPVMMGIAGQKPDLREVDGQTRIIPIEKYGVKCLSIGVLVDEDQPLLWRGPMVSTALRQLLLDTEWGELDYLIIDLPPGTGDIHLTLAQNFPLTGVVIVTTPQRVSVSDTRKTMEMFLNPAVNGPMLGVVENMTYFTPAELPDNKYYLFGEGGGEELSKAYNIPLLAQIPLIQGVSQESDVGVPAVMQNNELIQRSFIDLTVRVAQQVSIVNEKQTVA